MYARAVMAALPRLKANSMVKASEVPMRYHGRLVNAFQPALNEDRILTVYIILSLYAIFTERVEKA